MISRGEMATPGAGGGLGRDLDRAGDLRRRVEVLKYANKTLMHELAAVKLERARVSAELELAQRYADGLSQVCAADSVVAARQRSAANRLARKLARTRALLLAAALVGLAFETRRLVRSRFRRPRPLAWRRAFSADP